ncbi:uncharacterized protein LOC123560576 [Mercenaria mercenaria]|uniref:uncharacterized protein LOC123560576 n=1 Tax=Mercenaria mercenaria TaxID=6596 RepID=UPI00234E9771|nr:uncharacterized protein LOC123560576 [Mercenaria mercenaria]
MKTVRVNLYYIGCIAGIFVFIFLFRNLGYLIKEFALHVNVNVEVCDTCSMRHKNKLHNTERISNVIHQIYFPLKSKTPPVELTKARDTWIRAHKNYTHYLWNETSILKLMREHYPHLEPIYHSYDYWVRRLNIVKYLSTYHYGGWYADMDVTCKHNLDELTERAFRQNKSVVQHLTFPVGTSNDFFGVTPRHQFLKSVLDHLPNSNRWFIFPYPNTVLTTGTTYLWGRYLNYPYQDEFLILEQNDVATYMQHHHDSTWHGWDALLIRFFVHHFKQLFGLTILIVLVLVIHCLKRSHSNKTIT